MTQNNSGVFKMLHETLTQNNSCALTKLCDEDELGTETIIQHNSGALTTLPEKDQTSLVAYTF